uniref:Solute carrier family 35 member F2 n=1 Tax=Xiphophorus couchianus TaxID=32473 RepID=A0A3B5MME1_9TELE
MEGPTEDSLCGKWRNGCRLDRNRLKDIFSCRLLKTIAMGQVLSLLICGTAGSCQYLADAGVETPMLQSFLNYALLLLTYTPTLCIHRGDANILKILRTKWWKYLLMGLADVEANYMVVKAYQFTTLTSIQLLDCFVIPVLMVLSWIFLKTRYRPLHFVAVVVCLLGVGAMVGADIVAGRNQGSGKDAFSLRGSVSSWVFTAEMIEVTWKCFCLFQSFSSERFFTTKSSIMSSVVLLDVLQVSVPVWKNLEFGPEEARLTSLFSTSIPSFVVSCFRSFLSPSLLSTV